MKTFNIKAEKPHYFPRNVGEDEARSNLKAFDLRKTVDFFQVALLPRRASQPLLPISACSRARVGGSGEKLFP